jgi:hypothetical protein
MAVPGWVGVDGVGISMETSEGRSRDCRTKRHGTEDFTHVMVRTKAAEVADHRDHNSQGNQKRSATRYIGEVLNATTNHANANAEEQRGRDKRSKVTGALSPQ